jgi:hypothetical protein
MKERRDGFQRKTTAVHKMVLAMKRLSQVQSEQERHVIERWIAAWREIAALRQYKLGQRGKGPAAGA